MQTCYEHLTSKQADNKPYYEEVNDLALEQAKKEINDALDEGLERDIISKIEYNAMIVRIKSLGVSILI